MDVRKRLDAIKMKRPNWSDEVRNECLLIMAECAVHMYEQNRSFVDKIKDGVK